nr:Crp/Fnr family transcriptional regulator [uncultured Agathobaculum sp.]
MNRSILSKCRLFAGIANESLPALLDSLHAYERRYDKGQPVYRVGDTAHALCVLLSGSITIERDDAWGNKTILDHISPGVVFAETYACVPGTPMMVSAVSSEPSEVLFLPVDRLLTAALQPGTAHAVLLYNLLDVTMRKNLTLTRKIFHTSPRSLRGRLLSYLSAQAVQHGSDTFDIPFDRQQLADYLSADRSALSGELSKMQRDGLISFHKNHFVLNRSAKTDP